jgi:hypothetical protein
MHRPVAKSGQILAKPDDRQKKGNDSPTPTIYSYSGTCLKGIGTLPPSYLTSERRETKEITRIMRKKQAHTDSRSPQWQAV